MAKLYDTSPNGTARSIQLETMNITDNMAAATNSIWFVLQNGLIFQFGTVTFSNSNPGYITLPVQIKGRCTWFLGTWNGSSPTDITAPLVIRDGEKYGVAALRVLSNTNIYLSYNIAATWINIGLPLD